MKFYKSCLIILICLLLFVSVHSVSAEESTSDILQKSFEVSPGGTLNINVEYGSIEVKGTTQNVVDIKVFYQMKNFIVEFDKRDNIINVTGYFKGGIIKRIWSHLLGHEKIEPRFIVTVPSRFNVDLKFAGGEISGEELQGDIRFKTSGGCLYFKNIKGNIDGNTSGGSIDLSECMGRVHINTSGGKISIENSDVEVNAKTSGGSINVQNSMGAINAQTSGGNINVQLVEQPDRECRFITSGGNVIVSLPEESAVNIDALTRGGSVVTDFTVAVKGNIEKSKLEGEINGGGPLLFLKTSGGNIHIEKNKN